MNVAASVLLPIVEEALAGGAAVRIEVTGTSMTPFIHHGETVEIVPVGAAQFRRGDIVLARREDGAVLHRVVRQSVGSLWLAGDIGQPAMPVPIQSAVGRVVAVWRGGRPVRLDSRSARALAAAWRITGPVSHRLLSAAVVIRRCARRSASRRAHR